MAFFHGVQSKTLAGNVTSVSEIKTAVIGLIGTAPSGDTNKLVLCTSELDDAVLGTTGNIPEALAAIRLQGPATVLVVSIGTGTPAPDAAAFVGAVDAGTGARTGLKVFDLAFQTFGFKPKILIAPTYSATSGIAAALISAADTLKAIAYLDSPAGITVTAALALRGTGSQWNVSSSRAKLLFPGVKDLAGAVKPRSAYAAGLRAQVDANEGFWYSSSNHEYKGITGMETPVTFALSDENSQANALNAQGITTIINSFGTGYREWGNRNAAYPTKTDTTSFESVQRLDDITSEAIENTMFQFLDRPINQALIDHILNTVNGYFNTLIGQGALIEGSKCYFEESRNLPTDIAAGKLTFTKVFVGGIPAEDLTFYTKIDINLLENLG